MEPKYWLSAFSLVLCAGEIALALRGFPASSAGVGIGVGLWGFGLYALYRWSAGRRLKHDRRFAHRITLDRIVLGQLAAVVLAGAGSGIVLSVADAAPAAHVSIELQALILGSVVIFATVYVSSLVDWFWVLPRIAGIVREPPCVRPGGEQWDAVTSVWLFHRAVATVIVTVALAAIPGWLAAETGHGSTASAAWVVLGTALGIGFNSISGNSVLALRQAWNPPIRVGDTLLVRGKPTDTEMERAYVVDVSVQGLKYKVADAAAPRFRGKGRPISADAAADLVPEDDDDAVSSWCDGVENCRAINWYCCRNPHANTRSDRPPPAPAPLS
jgi:hypothetical protein